MLEHIKYINDKEIMSILNDNHVIQHRTKEERKKLVELYKTNRSELVYQLIINFDLLHNRNNEEQIILIKKVMSAIQVINIRTTDKLKHRVNLYMGLDDFKQYISRRNKELIQIVTKSNILKSRTLEEQLELITNYLNVDDINLYGAEVCQRKDFTYDIIINDSILKHFSNKEQLKFIELYSKAYHHNIDNKMDEILSNKVLFEKRSFSEINGMLWLLLENDTDEKLYRLVTDENILLNRTCLEQVEIIAKYWEELQDENYFGLFIDKDILENRNYKEQMQLIQLYSEQKTSDVYELIISESLLKNRRFEEQRELIYKYLQTDLKEIVFDMLIDENVSKVLSYQEQLALINSYFKPVNEDTQILNEYKEIIIDLRNTIVLKDLQIEELEKEITKCKK